MQGGDLKPPQITETLSVKDQGAKLDFLPLLTAPTQYQ